MENHNRFFVSSRLFAVSMSWRKVTLLLRFALLFAILMGGADFALAAPLPQTPESAAPKLTLIPAAAELTQQIQALVGGDADAEIEPQETFGTRALGLLLTFLNVAKDQGAAFITNFAALPQVVAWFDQQKNDSVLSARWVAIGQQLSLVVVPSLLAGFFVHILLMPLRRGVTRRNPSTWWARAGAIFAWLCLALVPVFVFLGMAVELLNQNDPPKLVRFVVMTVVYVLTLLRLIRLAVRFLFAPYVPALRLVPLASSQAAYIVRWIGFFSFVMVTGYFTVDLARLMRVPAGAVSAFSSLLGLVIVIMTIIVIVQKRAFVSSHLRGDLSAAQTGLTLGQSLRLWLARSWHVLAISYLVIGYIVTTLTSGGGFALMQRGTILTLVILLAMRLSLHMVARLGEKHPADDATVTAGIFRPVLRTLLRLATWGAAVAGIAAAWGVDVGGLFATAWGQRVMGSVFSIASTVLLVVLVYEMLHAFIERRLNRQDSEGHAVRMSARARTLLPMLRNAAIIVLTVIVGLVTLSELGVNIAPLLAGAGVIGVAIGFGSQTLVKDFLTGLFIILEDTIAVGDVVAIGEHKGEVESISIRTVRLRDVSGAQHILPFSEITKIINQSKGFSFAVMDLSVAYSSNLNRVMDVMREVGNGLRNDPAVKDFILEPLDMFGVENFADSAIVLRCRIKTVPGKQWPVKRAFMLKIKERFDAENIEIPFPTVVQMTRSGQPA